MKNLKINLYQLFIALSIIIFSSCENNSDPELLFEDTPTARIEKTINELKETLQEAEYGWKTIYFTDNTQLGGFTFLFDFTSNSEVKMDSDFGIADPSVASLYDVTLGSTVKLTFTTKNVIHQLSDGNNAPDADLKGEGYKGSFEFLYFQKDGEDLVFKSNRDRSIIIRFTKATEDDWVNLANDNKSMLANNIINDPSKAVFRNLVLENNGNTILYSFSFNKARRFATVKAYTDDVDNADISFGIAPTSDGFTISPAIEVDGVTLQNFVFNKENSEFVAEQNGIKLTLRYEDELNFLLPFYDFGNEPSGKNSIRLYSTRYNTSDDSQSFTAFFNDFKQHFTDTQNGRTVTRVYLYNLESNNPYLQVRYLSSGKTYSLNYTIQYTTTLDATGNLIVKFTEKTPVNSNRRNGVLPLIEFLTRDSGFYVEKRASNTLGLIAVDDLSILSHWYDF